MQADCSLFPRYGGSVVIIPSLFSDESGAGGRGACICAAGKRTIAKSVGWKNG